MDKTLHNPSKNPSTMLRLAICRHMMCYSMGTTSALAHAVWNRLVVPPGSAKVMGAECDGMVRPHAACVYSCAAPAPVPSGPVGLGSHGCWWVSQAQALLARCGIGNIPNSDRLPNGPPKNLARCHAWHCVLPTFLTEAIEYIVTDNNCGIVDTLIHRGKVKFY